MAVVDLMNLEDQVDLDFTVARRRAWLGRLKRRLLRRDIRGTLFSPGEIRRTVPASGAMYRLQEVQEGDRRGSNPRPSLEPHSADTCFYALPYIAETA
jgi:hypothetical protein